MDVLHALIAEAGTDRLRPFAGFISTGLPAAILLVVVGTWRAFAKAGYPGWAVLIPILNVYVIVKIAGRSGLWLLGFLVPWVNVVVWFVVAFGVARRFGHGAAAGFGLALLPWLFWPILGFGGSTYDEPPPDRPAFA